MPNGGDQNWVRLRAAIDGFRFRHRRWPTRIRINPISLDDLRTHVFTPDVFASIERRLVFIPDDNVGMIAEDEAGAAFDYGNEGFPPENSGPDAQSWLGDPPLKAGLY